MQNKRNTQFSDVQISISRICVETKNASPVGCARISPFPATEMLQRINQTFLDWFQCSNCKKAGNGAHQSRTVAKLDITRTYLTKPYDVLPSGTSFWKAGKKRDFHLLQGTLKIATTRKKKKKNFKDINCHSPARNFPQLALLLCTSHVLLQPTTILALVSSKTHFSPLYMHHISFNTSCGYWKKKNQRSN